MSSFNAKNLPSAASNKKPVPPLEPGGYPGRLVQVIIMGIQPSRPYKGEPKPPRLMMRNTYECLDEFLKDDEGDDIEDKPRWLSEEIPFMSLKADLATSTKRYYALDPEGSADGDWLKLLGAPCIINVINKASTKPGETRVFENIASISAMRPKEAAKAPALKNPTLAWDFYNPDVEVFKNFPEWIQERIKNAVDYPGSALEAALGEKTTVRVKPKTVVQPDEEIDYEEVESKEGPHGEDW